MSAAEAIKDQSGDGKEKQTLDAGGAAGAASNPRSPDSLEDNLRLLDSLIKNSDWLEKNTADMWVAANPAAAGELKQIFEEKGHPVASGLQPPNSESTDKQ